MSITIPYPELRSLYLISGFMKPYQNYDTIPLSINSIISPYLMEILLDQFVKGCYNDDIIIKYQSTQCLRKLLSCEHHPCIPEIINTGVVPRLVSFLHDNSNEKLQFESAWALTNIASGDAEHTATVIKHGAVPILVSLLNSNSMDVKNQAVWGIGNIAGDSPECRNLVLNYNVFKYLIPLCSINNIKTKKEVELLRNATWTLSNLCRGKPAPNWEYISVALFALNDLLNVPDIDVLQDACWSYSYISDIDNFNDDIRIHTIVQSGALYKLINLLSHDSNCIKHPALRAIGNIITNSDHYTQQVIDHGTLPKLFDLLSTNKMSLKKEACWVISNITAGLQDQIQRVIDEGIIQKLVDILNNDKFDIQKEAAWAVSNATAGGNDDHIQFLVSQNVIPSLINLMDCQHTRTILICLEGIENILTSGDNNKINGINKYIDKVTHCNSIKKLIDLQTNNEIPNDIKSRITDLIRKYNITIKNIDNIPKKPIIMKQNSTPIQTQNGNGNGTLYIYHGIHYGVSYQCTLKTQNNNNNNNNNNSDSEYTNDVPSLNNENSIPNDVSSVQTEILYLSDEDTTNNDNNNSINDDIKETPNDAIFIDDLVDAIMDDENSRSIVISIQENNNNNNNDSNNNNNVDDILDEIFISQQK